MSIWSTLILALSVSSSSWAAPFYSQIAEQDKKDIEAYLETHQGQLTGEQADTLLEKLMGTKNYQSMQILSNKKGDYFFKGVLNKIVGKIRFQGRSSIDEIEALNALAIKPESRLDTTILPEAAERLQTLYGQKGFFRTQIDVTVPPTSNVETEILIDIKEGDPCRIHGVVFYTDNSKLKAAVNRVARSFNSKLFSERNIENLEAEVQEHLHEGRYLNSYLVQQKAEYNSEKTEATLYYQINEPYSYYLQMNGHSAYSRADLIRAADLENFDRTSLNPAIEIADRIRTKYLASGYPHVKINAQKKDSPEEFKKIIELEISEGNRVKIKSFDVKGRLSRSPDYYINFIKNNSTDAIDSGYFVQGDLETGAKNLLTELNNQGYLRAELQSLRHEYNDRKDEVQVHLILDEGPLTQVNNIQFTGNTQYSEQQLISHLGVSPNSPLRLNKLEVGLENIKNFYKSNGHIEMYIENERKDLVTYGSKGYEASLLIKIYEGPKVFVREILVEGNSFTRDYVIQKEINIDPGEILTPEKIDEAQKRLDKLNIFSRVEIRTLEANTQVSERALVVSVTERNPGTFRVGLGVTNKRKFTVRGFTGVSYSNLGGKARAISVRATAENNVANANYMEYELAVGYLEPFLFDSRYRGRVNLSREEEVADYSGSTSTIDRTDKFGTLVERDITSKVKFTWNFYSLESIERFFDPRPPPGQTRSRERIASIGPLLDIDYRDNPFLPTAGHFSRLEADYSAPELGSSDDIQFIRTQATFSYYMPIYKKSLVWANSVRAGHARNISTERTSAIPRSYAFFLGGYTTIRGFSGTDSDRTPTDPELNVNSDQLLVIPSETNYHLIKSELRFPIYEILGGVLFYDAGGVDVQKNHNMPQKLKRSFGVGLRINTPVGPISLDYGKKIDPQNNESPDHFHLSIGTF